MVKRRRNSEGEKARKEGAEKSVTGGVEAAAAKVAGGPANSTTGTGSALTTALNGKVPHFTRSSARRASEVDNADKTGGSKNQAASTTTPKPIPVPVATRTSGRVIKRPRRDGSPPPSPPKKHDHKQDSHTPDRKHAERKPDNKQRSRRQWELWSVEDKQIFFGGLYEFGKDFDAIQNLFVQKHKRRGDSEVVNKTKDQIRHFYYRTWHKIAKHIATKDDTAVSKQALELYGLINYGELRKRIGGGKLDEKNGQKLNELVQKGTTVIKVKGRTHRLKTPGCRALKKMNNVEDNNKDDDASRVKVPDQLSVELAPRTNEAWAQVQSLAQNPRIRIKLKSDRKLSSIIEFLNKKWKPDRVRMKEGMDEKEALQQEVKLYLSEKVKVFPVAMEIAPPHPRLDLGLEHYKEYVRTHPALENSPSGRKGRGPKSSSHANRSSNKQAKEAKEAKTQPSVSSETLVKDEPDGSGAFSCLRHDANGNHLNNNEAVPMETETESVTTVMKQSIEGSGQISSQADDVKWVVVPEPKAYTEASNPPKVEDPVPRPASNTPGPTNVPGPSNAPGRPSNVPGVRPVAGASESTLENDPVDWEKMHLLEKGLSKRDAGHFSIAELYLMMGSPDKMLLHYEWVDVVEVPNILQLDSKLTNKLRRLIHLASTEFTDFRKTKPLELTSPESPHKCSCGRTLNQATTPTVKGTASKKVGRSPATPKGGATCSGGVVPRPCTPKSTQTVGQDLDSPPGVKTVMTVPTVTKGPAVDDSGVFPLPVGIPVRPRPVVDRLDQLAAINKQPDLFIPRRRRLQRNVRRPMLPVQRTLLPKSMPITMLPSNSQIGSSGSFLATLPTQIPSPAVVNTSPGGRHASVKTELKRPVIRRICPNPSGVTGVNALTMSPGDIMKGAVIKADIQGLIARNHLQNATLTALTSGVTTSCVATTVVGTAPAGRHGANRSMTPVEREVAVSGTETLVTAGPSTSTSTSTSSALVKSAIVGEDSFLGVSPQMPTVASNRSSNGCVGASAMGDLSLHGGESLSGLSALLDISLPVPTDGDTNDKFLDMTMGENTRTTFFGLLDDKSNSVPVKEDMSEPRPATPALSPTKNFKLPAEFMWPGGETPDFSLSQLLESPLKRSSSASASTSSASVSAPAATVAPSAATGSLTQSQVSVLSENSRDSIILGKLDVESTLQCMLNENSMDYVAKFADLAAQIAASAGDSGSTRRTDS